MKKHLLSSSTLLNFQFYSAFTYKFVAWKNSSIELAIETANAMID